MLLTKDGSFLHQLSLQLLEAAVNDTVRKTACQSGYPAGGTHKLVLHFLGGCLLLLCNCNACCSCPCSRPLVPATLHNSGSGFRAGIITALWQRQQCNACCCCLCHDAGYDAGIEAAAELCDLEVTGGQLEVQQMHPHSSGQAHYKATLRQILQLCDAKKQPALRVHLLSQAQG